MNKPREEEKETTNLALLKSGKDGEDESNTNHSDWR
jgi:hypothetical protein